MHTDFNYRSIPRSRSRALACASNARTSAATSRSFAQAAGPFAFGFGSAAMVIGWLDGSAAGAARDGRSDTKA